MSNTLTVEEGYRLAKFQRPGVKIVMGPECAREEWIDPRPCLYGRAWGDRVEPTPVKETATSWFEYDCSRLIDHDCLNLIGKKRIPLWSLAWLYVLSIIRPLTRDDVLFFCDANTTLSVALEYIETELTNDRTPNTP